MRVEVYPVGGQPDPETTFSVMDMSDAKQTLICQIEATIQIKGLPANDDYFKALKECLKCEVDKAIVFGQFVHVIKED